MIKQSNLKLIIRNIILIFVTVAVIGGVVTFSILKEISLAKFNSELLIKPREDIVLYDCNNEVFEALAKREFTEASRVPKYLKDAIVSIEDKKFYTHNGVDYKRIAGAAFNNMKKGKIVQGGSTISQQLIKNTHLTNEKKLGRKIDEFFLAKKLEDNYNKDEIINMYINVVYFGNGTYGVADASKLFFGKNYHELNLEECAILAATLNSPRLYSPVYSPYNAVKRRNLVLSEMKKDYKITESEYQDAVTAPLELTQNRSIDSEKLGDSYYLAAIDEAKQLLNHPCNNTGLRIYTNYNKKLQNSLISGIIKDNYTAKNKNGQIPAVQGLIADNYSGEIEAYYASSVKLRNLKRQPASTIKPILVYAPAIEYNIISPATQILDEKINFDGYSPKNHNNKFSGYISVRESLSESLNVPAVKIIDYVGIEKAKEFAARAGISFDKNDAGYSVALGGFSNGITLTEIANTYQSFANDGNFIKCGMVEKITDAKGRTLYQRDASTRRIMRDDTAYLITDMLKTSAKTGTALRLASLGGVAAKTGTVGNSEGNSDAYCIAYTKDRTFAVWNGNIHASSNNMDINVNGSSFPSMQVRDTIKNVYKTENPHSFTKPETVKSIIIDADELKINRKEIKANNNTRHKINEVFSIYKLPADNIKIVVKKDKPEDIVPPDFKNNYLVRILELFGKKEKYKTKQNNA